MCNCCRPFDHYFAVRTQAEKHVIHPVPLRCIWSEGPATLGARRICASITDVSSGGYRPVQRCGFLHAARCTGWTLAGVAFATSYSLCISASQLRKHLAEGALHSGCKHRSCCSSGELSTVSNTSTQARSPYPPECVD
jgi:hypothetical protein